jgi:heme oxygenase (biliverdin-IX-beta and delta-forming)
MPSAEVARPPPRSHDAVAALKAVTADSHERLERRFDLDARLRSAAAYAELLETMLGFYRPLEARVSPHAAAIAGLDWPRRRKTPLLRADLQAVGRATDAPSPRDARRALPVVDSIDQALGVLYVLEGATLGGVLIARQARHRLGITPHTGGAFFTAYGSATAARWSAFADVVETVTGGVPSAATCDAALACFTAMEAWLCSPPS